MFGCDELECHSLPEGLDALLLDRVSIPSINASALRVAIKLRTMRGLSALCSSRKSVVVYTVEVRGTFLWKRTGSNKLSLLPLLDPAILARELWPSASTIF